MGSLMPSQRETGRMPGQSGGSPHEVLSHPLGWGWGTKKSGGPFTVVPHIALAGDGGKGKGGRSPWQFPTPPWRGMEENGKRGGHPVAGAGPLTPPGQEMGASRERRGGEGGCEGGTAGVVSAAPYVILYISEQFSIRFIHSAPEPNPQS